MRDLEQALAALHEASLASNADDEHDPEGATIAFERQQLVATLESARRTSSALHAARDRSLSGGPVLCRVCGDPVPAARLAVRPQSDTCVACAGRNQEVDGSTIMKKIGFLSFGHWNPSARSATRSAVRRAPAVHRPRGRRRGGRGRRCLLPVHHFAQQLASPFPRSRRSARGRAGSRSAPV